jgi:hypothetical protein
MYYAQRIVYHTGLWLVKQSFLAVYWSMRRSFTKRVTILMYVTIAYVIITYIINEGLSFFWCWPITTYWYYSYYSSIYCDFYLQKYRDLKNRCSNVNSPVPTAVSAFTNVTTDILSASLNYLTLCHWNIGLINRSNGSLFVDSPIPSPP